MASKSPLQKLQHAVVDTVKGAVADPVGTAGKAVQQARGTIALGKSVAGQVSKGAAGAVTGRLHGHRVGDPAAPAVEGTAAPEWPAPPTPATTAPAAKATPQAAAPRKVPTPTKAPVTDLATEVVKRRAVNQPPEKAAPAPVSSIDAAADQAHVEATPADLAKKVTTAKKATTAKKTATRPPAKRAPAAKKAPAKKAPPAKEPAPKDSGSTPSDRLPPRKRARVADPDEG